MYRYKRIIKIILSHQDTMMIVVAAIMIMLLFPANVLSTKGVDYSVRVSTQKIQCLVGKGFTFAIPRGYRSVGKVDTNVVANLKSAWDGGMKYVDVYMFPCVSCGNPKGQVDSLINALANSKYGMIWLDIERLNWPSNYVANRRFILDMVAELKEKQKSFGIYTNLNNWAEIVGQSWDGVKDYPLWYAHYDSLPNYSDFKAFGGWTRPAMKQYKGDTTVCGVGVDLSYYP